MLRAALSPGVFEEIYCNVLFSWNLPPFGPGKTLSTSPRLPISDTSASPLKVLRDPLGHWHPFSIHNLLVLVVLANRLLTYGLLIVGTYLPSAL